MYITEEGMPSGQKDISTILLEKKYIQELPKVPKTISKGVATFQVYTVIIDDGKVKIIPPYFPEP